MSVKTFSLSRLKKMSLRESSIYRAGGRLQSLSSTELVLQSQGLSQVFQITLNSIYLNLKGEVVKDDVSSFKHQDHICVSFQYKNSQYLALELQILAHSKSKPKKWSFSHSKSWSDFLREVEGFFLSQNFQSIQTPSLVNQPSTEPYLEFYSTEQKRPSSRSQKKWLAASPELSLKKVLCRGASDIFEIHKSYRNNEEGPWHLDEFYMLEWYRAYSLLGDIVLDLKALLNYLKSIGRIQEDLPLFKEVSVKELFKKYLNFELTPQTQDNELYNLLQEKQIPCTKNRSFNEYFHLLFLNKIEPQLDLKTPYIIYDYPPSLRAYSKINKRGFADRFEFYWRGVELANAFFEVNEASVQKQLFQQDLLESKNKNPIDQDYLSEMESGMPPCSGIALGLERLFSVIEGYKDLQNWKSF